MNEEAQKMLQTVLGKDPQSLTVEEVGFLRARSGYLTSEQKRVFSSVLGIALSVPEQSAEPRASTQYADVGSNPGLPQTPAPVVVPEETTPVDVSDLDAIEVVSNPEPEFSPTDDGSGEKAAYDPVPTVPEQSADTETSDVSQPVSGASVPSLDAHVTQVDDHTADPDYVPRQ